MVNTDTVLTAGGAGFGKVAQPRQAKITLDPSGRFELCWLL